MILLILTVSVERFSIELEPIYSFSEYFLITLWIGLLSEDLDYFYELVNFDWFELYKEN